MSLDESFSSEIDAAVEEVMANQKEFEESKESENENVEQENLEQKVEETSEDLIEDNVDTEVNEEKETKEAKQENKAETSTTQPISQISDEALTRAVQCGLSVAEARQFPSESSLLTTCAVIERQSQQYTKQEKEEEDPLRAIDDLDPDDPEGFDPEAVQLLKTLAGQIRAQRDEIQQLRSGQEYSLQAGQEAARRETEDRFDKQVEALGEDFQKSLGVGSYRSLTQGSQELAKRDAIAQRMAVTMAGYQAMGRQSPPFDEVFQEAAAIVLADEFAAVKERKVQGDLQKMGKTHIQRAKVQGSKAKQQLSPEAEAAAILSEKYGI